MKKYEFIYNTLIILFILVITTNFVKYIIEREYLFFGFTYFFVGLAFATGIWMSKEQAKNTKKVNYNKVIFLWYFIIIKEIIKDIRKRLSEYI